MVARLVRDQEVPGSNPGAPTIFSSNRVDSHEIRNGKTADPEKSIPSRPIHDPETGRRAAMKRRPMIAVIGAGDCSGAVSDQAETVGRLLAQRGARVLCGGLGGVMEAASRGARSAGGETIGILPGSDPDAANPFIDIAIATGLGYIRNVLLIRASDAVIAIDGKAGTLSEVAFSLIERKPVVSLGSWNPDPSVVVAESPEDSVEKVFRLIGNGPDRG
jgi:uncharacterized protein (TIGR00725 family)